MVIPHPSSVPSPSGLHLTSGETARLLEDSPKHDVPPRTLSFAETVCYQGGCVVQPYGCSVQPERLQDAAMRLQCAANWLHNWLHYAASCRLHYAAIRFSMQPPVQPNGCTMQPVVQPNGCTMQPA